MLSRLEISQSDFDELTAFIKEKYGLDLARKKSIVESRLSNYVLDCGFNSFSEHISCVKRTISNTSWRNFSPMPKKTSSIMICVYGVQAAHSATSHIILPCVWTIISALTAVSGT